MVFAGCEKQEDLGPATIKTLETALTFPLDGGTQSITLKATRDWTAVVSPKDCGITVSPSSGKGSNDAQTITVSAGKNTGRNTNGKITITAGSMKPVVVTVTQPGELGALYYADEISSLAVDTEVIVEGVVVGVNKKGGVVKDNTGLVLIYDKDATAALAEIGKKVKVEGKVSIYGDLKQVAPTKVTVAEDAAVEVNHGEPVVANVEFLEAPVLDKVYYMTLEGVYKVSGDYHNIVVEGASRQGSLQYPVQNLASVVEHKVKFYGYFAGGNNAKYYNFLVTSFEDLGEVKLEMSTVAEALAGNKGASVLVQGTVAAVSKKSLVLKDDTGVIYVYTISAPAVAVGDNVEITGQLDDPYDQGFLQIASPSVKALGTTSTVDYGTAKEIKLVAGLNAYINAPALVEYVAFEGVVKGYDVFPTDGVDGDVATTAYYYPGDLSVYEGKTVTMNGYAVGKDSSGKTVNVVVTSVEADPFLAVDAVAIEVGSSAVSTQINVLSNLAWTVTKGQGAEWIKTVTESGNGMAAVEVTFDSNTSGESRSATLVISAEGVDPVSVVITQKAPSQSGEVVDLIDRAYAGTNSSSYKVWTKSGSASSAEYNGRTAGEEASNDIRITTSSNSGLVTTVSGGKLKKVYIKWNNTKSGTTARTVKVYGKATAYETYSDAYDANKCGELIGSCSFKKDEEVSEFTFEIPADKEYRYVAFASDNSVCYLDKIEITWQE